MLCVQIAGDGSLQVLQPQPAVTSSCAYIIQSGAEVTNNPFLMTTTEATELGVAIASLWVTVAVLKHISRR